ALVEVEREPERAVGGVDELVRHDAGETLDVGDAVSGVDDVADLRGGRLGGVVGLDEVLEGIAGFMRADRYVCHLRFLVFACASRPTWRCLPVPVRVSRPVAV